MKNLFITLGFAFALISSVGYSNSVVSKLSDSTALVNVSANSGDEIGFYSESCLYPSDEGSVMSPRSCKLEKVGNGKVVGNISDDVMVVKTSGSFSLKKGMSAKKL